MVDRDRVKAEGVVSFAGVPLIIGERVLGALGVALRKAHSFSEEDLSLLHSLANHAAIAIENARLYAETSGHLVETRALLEVAEILNSTLDPKRVLKQVAHQDRPGVPGGPVLDRALGRRPRHPADVAVRRRPEGRGDVGGLHGGAGAIHPGTCRPTPRRSRRAGRSIIADAQTSDLIPREWTEAFEHKSYMAVPLIRQDTVIGVMSLDYTERVTAFERWQVDLAMAIGSQLALTIENTRLYSEAQERLGETATLLAVAQVLSQPAPAGEVMRRLAREVARAFGADMVGVYLVDERKEALVPTAGYHVPKHLVQVFTHATLRAGALPRAARCLEVRPRVLVHGRQGRPAHRSGDLRRRGSARRALRPDHGAR